MSNPLLPTAPPPPPPPERVEPSPVLGDELTARFGPQAPLTNVAAPTGSGLPTEHVTANPLLWVVGVHGGSGASTVAALCGEDALELPQRLPLTPAGAPAPRVLLVARTHATGLHYAGWMASHWASGQRATTTNTGTLDGRSVDTEVTDSQLLPRVLRGAVVADRFAVALSGVAVSVVDQKAA